MPHSALDYAAQVLGPCELVKDCSWEHGVSSVLCLRDTSGLTWFLKRHRDRERYNTELRAYRHWVPALGRSAPRLRACDDSRATIILSAVPGEPAPWPAPEAAARPDTVRAAEQAIQQGIHRRAGALLRAFHDAQAPIPCDDLAAAKIAEFDQLRPLATALLTERELTKARERVTALAAVDGITCTGLVACHRDYTPRNWLISDDALYVLDFEWSRLDVWLSDLTRLHLGIWPTRPDLREAFLSGYGRLLSAADREILDGCAVVMAVWLLIKAHETGQPSFEANNRKALLRLLAM
jgi:tRNA A-37 threonylcarbamoyl transferase component Bud32